MPSDVTIGTLQENSEARVARGNVGSNFGMFFFPSTLPESSHGNLNVRVSITDIEDSASKLSDPSEIGFMGPAQGASCLSNLSWSSDYGMSNSLDGRAISCSLNSIQDTSGLSYRETASTNQNDLSSCRGPLFNHKVASGRAIKNSETILSSSFDGSLSPHIEIEPPMLDWGEKYLYIPSLAYLTVLNTWNDSILHVYQPFSTDSQFFPCNFTEAILEPGEAASICFVFLPKSLGLSSSHLILQTSFGGFLVQAKGFAAEFPYGQALSGSELSSSGRWRKNFSLFNPFDENIHVEEIAMWVSVSLGNTSVHVDATCSARECDHWDSSDCKSLSIKDWFLVKTANADSSLMAMRPLSSWEIGPRTSETVAEIDLSFGSVARISGAFCMQLTRASQDEAAIVMLPVEAEIDRKTDSDNSASLVTFSLESVSPPDAGKDIIAVSLRNSGPHVVSVGKISGVADSELLQIEHMEGLLLFPRTTTKVVFVSCTPHQGIPDVNRSCKLLVQTNDSRSPIEILCNDIVHLCSRHQDSSVGCNNPSSFDVSSRNMRTGSLTRGTDMLPYAMAMEAKGLDNLVLQNWKSQGTDTEVSVLEDHELLFSVVQVGDHLSKWITVRNPSQQPVAMQLILNSAEIIDECQASVEILIPVTSAGFVQPGSISPRRYGFSLADGARTEAFVHPHSTASLGPVIFHPSSRCKWKSSALIRNNLSGVEWMSLQGSGGSYSLALIENSELVWSLEFQLEVPQSLNISLPNIGAKIEDVNRACLRPVIKELYAKNMGDFPLDMQKIRVSGTDCGSGRFLVQNCSQFVLEPGQSRVLLVSYLSDFSGSVVHGDLELALGSGIIVIPMRARVPNYTLELCKKSLFWTRVKKLLGGFLIIAPFLCLALFSVFPRSVPFCSKVFHYKGNRDSVGIIPSVGKSSGTKGDQKGGKLISPSSKVSVFSPVDEEEPLLARSVRCADNHQSTSQEPVANAQHKHSHSVKLKEREPLNLVSSESSNVVERSQLDNLTVKIGKEKGRRRRKRRGAGNVLTGLFEVSSSHSGNSTPSSPLSPVSSITPRRMWPVSPDGDRYPLLSSGSSQVSTLADPEVPICNQVSTLADPEVPICNESRRFPPQEEQPSPASGGTTNKPLLLPSATFPSAGRPIPSMPLPSHFQFSTATIAPHARAPGSKLYGNGGVKPEEKLGSENQFTYDIWGDHFSGLKLMGGGSVDDSAVVPRAVNSDSESFFVRGPQALMTKYPQESVSFKNAVNG
ncbi:hypothetical protein CDL15_Pgr013462 [Punica granatum]|nr:hypothetical protein CDL15_Pgr013462 [Punica granatum]